MDITQIFKKSWGLLWRYRALWFFGFLLALTVGNGWWFGYPFNRNEDFQANNRIIISDNQTWYFRGEGVTIDLTTPGGPSIQIEGLSPAQLRQIERELNVTNLWSIVVVASAVLLLWIILATLLRYTSEASVIRMVDENERNDQLVRVGRGLRLGWSRIAWRLFLIDLVIGLLAFLFFTALLILALMPLLLIAAENAAATFVGILFTILFLTLFVLLAVAAGIILSMTLPVMRRACAVNDLGVIASMRMGFRLLGTRFEKVALTWLVWMGVRLLWMIASIPIFIVLSPLILLTLLVGAVIGSIPGLLTAGIASIFTGGATPWIIGAIVALPVFILVLLSPLIFVSGLVEVFKSTFWTLSYREFRPAESALPQPAQKLESAGV
jgi:hypothetical protein